ncbi:hypothetical protein DH2020_001256 [Rehmannia glutinosa]|uniref:Auxin-responsive protein n=1 Tax=Rehmannia glutinosa TaxID=99300 RepID=A0ABR0XYU1_REHGL
MSTLSREENEMVMMSSEESSNDSELELGLGLSLGGGKAKFKPPSPAAATAAGGGSWDQYARILTAKDFRSGVSTKTSSSSSSSSSSVTKANINGSCGTKRTAESPSSPPGLGVTLFVISLILGESGTTLDKISQVVGWPPVRSYRMNSLANNAKSPVTKDFFSTVDKCKSKNIVVDKNNITKEKGVRKTSLFVKVNMDGIPIGRKVDLNAHSCYETLARALDDMFRPSAAVGPRRSNVDEQGVVAGTRQSLQLLDSSSDFVLTYEDKEGDWMLVGDVPWEMFLNSVRRLRIMRTAEANGLGGHDVKIRFELEFERAWKIVLLADVTK